MDRRALIAIALSFVVLFGSNLLFQKLGWIPSPQSPPKNEAVQAPASRPSAAPGAAQIAPTTPTPATTNAQGGWAASADTLLTIDQPHYTVRIRTQGARLLSVLLKDYKDGDSGKAMLAADPPLALDLGDRQTPVSLADVPFAYADSLDASGRIAKVTFTARDSSGLTVQQAYRFSPDDYKIGYEVGITGLNPRLDLKDYRLTLASWPLLTERNKLEDLNNLGVTAKVGKDNKREMAIGLKKGAKTREGAIGWLAVHSKYFMVGLVAQNVEGIATSADLAPGTTKETHDAVVGDITVPLPQG